MKYVIFFQSNSWKQIHKLFACFSKYLISHRTAQQIDTKLIHICEKFNQNLLVKFHFMNSKDFDFLIYGLKQKTFSLGFVSVKNIASLKLCHMLLKQPAENVFHFK